jgi:hypothetical protein
MAYSAPEQSADAIEHRASRPAARTHEPPSRSTKWAGRAIQPDPLTEGVPLLPGPTHVVVEGHHMRIIGAVLHTDPPHLLTVAAPGFDPSSDLSRPHSEVPVPS